MKYLLLTLAISVGLAAGVPGSVSADTSLAQTSQAILSCTDGHSVSLGVDPTTLASLAADVQAINAGATGTTCTLNTAASNPSTGTASWTVFDYNPSGQEIAPRNSPNSHPATTTGTTTSFDFLDGHYTALLTTNDKSLTGDLSTTTLHDSISVDGPASTFETQHSGGTNCASNFPAAVRFFFTAPSASGTYPFSPVGFYTSVWWSNPISVHLLNGNQGTMDISASMADPNEWSDWNGQRGTVVPVAFEKAIHKVQSIGLSFGGDCFFETGVRAVYPTTAPPPYEMFHSTFTETSP